MRRTLLLIAIAALLAPSAAQAAFPGENGKLIISRGGAGDGGVWSVNPDGTDLTQLIPGGGDFFPRWSPDGNRFLFNGYDETAGLQTVSVANADGSAPAIVAYGSQAAWSPDGDRIVFRCSTGLCTVNADGTKVTPLISGGQEPSWSPDGTKILYSEGTFTEGALRVMNADGTNDTVVAANSDNGDWSPDGSKIVYYSSQPDGNGDIWTMNADGTNKVNLTPHPGVVERGPVWSPDGKKIAYRGAAGVIVVMNADGSDPVSFGEGYLFAVHRDGPDWQPILRGYPRPKGAGTLHAPLVPAYQPCAAPNRVHAPPLSFDSRYPPSRHSTDLTLGTPDANGRAANSVASLRLGRDPRQPGHARRRGRGEPDHLDHRRARLRPHRLHRQPGDAGPARDHRQVQHPLSGRTRTGTVQEFTLTWSVPCAATADTNIGANCSLFTTADTLLPGSALEGRRAIWDTDRIEVRDGAGQPFLRQGVFVP